MAWEKRIVQDLSDDITVGFVGSMSKIFTDTGVPLLRGQNINPYKLNLENLKYIPNDIHKKWKKSSLKEGDVAIVRVGYPGTACVIPANLGDVNAASLVIVRPNKDLLNPHWLEMVLNSDWGKKVVSGYLVGSAQQVFNTKTAAKLEIPYPDIYKQNQIVDFINYFNQLLVINSDRLNLLESFSVKFHHNFLNNPSVKVKDLQKKRLGELITLVKDGVSPNNVSAETRYIGIEHLPRKSWSFKGCGVASDVTSNKLKFTNKDILFGNIRPYFHKVLFSGFSGICSSDIAVIRASQGLEYFIFNTVYSTNFVSQAVASSKGTKMPRANWNALLDFELLVPSVETLVQYNNILEPVMNLMININEQNLRLYTLRDKLVSMFVTNTLDFS